MLKYKTANEKNVIFSNGGFPLSKQASFKIFNPILFFQVPFYCVNKLVIVVMYSMDDHNWNLLIIVASLYDNACRIADPLWGESYVEFHTKGQ